MNNQEVWAKALKIKYGDVRHTPKDNKRASNGQIKGNKGNNDKHK